ncbi:MAG: hypothetical protein ACLFWF_01785 [Alphaproteobacteria bacterium]
MLLALALPLAAFQCIQGGVHRGAMLSAPPDFSCIEEAVRSVESVDRVRYEPMQGSRPLTWSGIKPPSHVHYFHYRVADTRGVFYIHVNYKNEARFSHSLLFRSYPLNPDHPELKDENVRKKYAQEIVDVLLPVMPRIEEAIAEQCNVPALRDVEASCTWVSCDDG